MKIRKASERDLLRWAQLRAALWPDSDDEHAAELAGYFAGKSVGIVEAFMLVDSQDQPVGFLELNLRDFVEGARSPRVPYVEAWYVASPYRGFGHGKALMHAAELWTKDQGYNEFASDTEVTNESSVRAHKACGFEEVGRVVCLLKQLTHQEKR